MPGVSMVPKSFDKLAIWQTETLPVVNVIIIFILIDAPET